MRGYRLTTAAIKDRQTRKDKQFDPIQALGEVYRCRTKEQCQMDYLLTQLRKKGLLQQPSHAGISKEF